MFLYIYEIKEDWLSLEVNKCVKIIPKIIEQPCCILMLIELSQMLYRIDCPKNSKFVHINDNTDVKDLFCLARMMIFFYFIPS